MDYDNIVETEAKCDDRSHDLKILKPAVSMYCPYTIKGLKKGEIKFWCRCGLSKKQPWCDGSHIDTGFRPLRWEVPEQQYLYQICACKYTNAPPFCDATHTNLPTTIISARENCPNLNAHDKCEKLCTGCGWVPDF